MRGILRPGMRHWQIVSVEISTDRLLTDLEARAAAVVQTTAALGLATSGPGRSIWQAVGPVMVHLHQGKWSHVVECRRELTYEQFLNEVGTVELLDDDDDERETLDALDEADQRDPGRKGAR